MSLAAVEHGLQRRALEGGVVVTGASSGIGAALAAALESKGFTVGCLSRRGSTPSPSGEGRLIALSCDVTDYAAAARVLDSFAEQAGGIRALINNAGGHVDCHADELAPELVRDALELGVVSPAMFSQFARRHMAPGGGMIVNVGSAFGRMGVAGSLAYAAAKAALASVTRTLAVEWARDGIAVVTLAPGYVATEMNRAYLEQDAAHVEAIERRIPVRRLAHPAEIARLIVALIEADVPFLTGETIYADGGQGIA